MKKIYNAPEAGLLCFRPVEELANFAIDLDKLLGTGGVGKGDAVEGGSGDIKINI